MGCFLDETKDRVDQDPEATPYDDLRHYAYEGRGFIHFFMASFLIYCSFYDIANKGDSKKLTVTFR